MEHLAASIIQEAEDVHQVDLTPSRMDHFVRYLTDGTMSDNPPEGRWFKWRASQFVLVNEQLYKWSFSLPLLKCLRSDESDYVLWEIHEGICGNHLGARTITWKALQQGYYWLTMREDALELVKKCDRCQRFTNLQHLPSNHLSQLTSPWPFVQWKMDILGPFPPAIGQRKFLLIAIDYFTKWVEVEPLAHITEQKVKNFFQKSVICRYGLPHILITDNGRQFDNQAFRKFYEDYHIKH